MKTRPITITNIAVATILLLLMPTNKDALYSRSFTVNMIQSEINSITTNHSKPSQHSTFKHVKASLFSPINLLTDSEPAIQRADSQITEVSLTTAQAYLNRVYLSGRYIVDKDIIRLKDIVTYTF